jgi:hypothetical protein
VFEQFGHGVGLKRGRECVGEPGVLLGWMPESPGDVSIFGLAG